METGVVPRTGLRTVFQPALRVPNGASSIAIFRPGRTGSECRSGRYQSSRWWLPIISPRSSTLPSPVPLLQPATAVPAMLCASIAGSRLEDSVAADVPFNISFSNAARCADQRNLVLWRSSQCNEWFQWSTLFIACSQWRR